ncbi:MAG: hypothetical protein Kow00108_01740 [Calditrichia bacterium]
MQYTLDIVIDLPRDRVIDLFDNPDNLKKWQPDLLSFTHLEGDPGQPGAKSLLKYRWGKKEMEMIETIVSRNLPDHFSGIYEAGGVWNKVSNKFEETEDGRTRWIVDNEFQFKGLYKLMGFFMPGSFKKQTLKYMHQFKAFAETHK